jgi:hypothetical protein
MIGHPEGVSVMGRRPLVLLLVLGLAAATLGVAGAAAPAAAEPATVTVAGSFQQELGCPGDWQPECAATHLTLDAEDGVWQGTFPLPAGTWEYKAALDGTWAENYGADGADQLAYILHRGDTKDPGPDQFLVFDTYGHEVWQLQGADPERPYAAPPAAMAAGP